uniref:Armadillo repeat-containing domain-containing protein n=1 Tax=Oryza barthii TaxID=65489 RepID=A0A0D3GPN3_9ORYZ
MLLINSVTLPEPSGAAGDDHCHGAVVNMVVPPREPRASPERKKGTSETRKLSKHNVLYRACLVDANAVPWLLCLLSSTAVAMQDNVVASLLNLSKHPARRMTIVEVGGVGLVVNVINISPRPRRITTIPEAIPTLVQLIRDGAYRSRKNAMVSLYGLLQSAANQGKAIAAGAVSALAALLSTDRDDLASHSIKLMVRKAEQPLGAMAVLSQPGLVAHLTDALAASSSSRSANVVKQHDAAVHKKHH